MTTPQRWVRVVLAAALYFAAVFAVGLMLGPVRVVWLEPRLGRTLAVLTEAPVLVAAMWFAGAAAPRWAGLIGCGRPHYLAIGVLALLLQQAADLAVGIWLRGMTVPEQAAQFATPAGGVYLLTLLLFAAMPWIRATRAAHVAARAQGPTPPP